jgi:NADPH:quinone reductase-like Zn-dependent oxidoreductase
MKPIIGRRFQFDEIIAAHEYLQTRRSTGKVVVQVVEGG